MEQQKVEEILGAFEEALSFWQLQLTQKGDDLKTEISPAKVSNPMEEVVKVCKLIKAHTTKVGILFEPSAIEKAGSAAVKTVLELSSTFVLFMSLLSQLSPIEISHLYHKEILTIATSIIANCHLLVNELSILLKEANSGRQGSVGQEERDLEATKDAHEVKQNDSNSPTVDPRLVSVGKIWATSDKLASLIEAGNLRFLEKQTKMQLTLIDDGLDEFSEWAENPEEFDDEDPFGLDDDYSDADEDENDSAPPAVDEDGLSDEQEENSKDKKRLSEYSKLWLEKIKLVRLLFLSINKSLPLLIGGEKIDQIYDAQELICRDIDLLIVELMLNQVVDHVVEKHATSIDKGCFKIMKISKTANEKSPSKVKWCTLWESKFKGLLHEMYTTED